MMPLCLHKTNRGFTLIELLVAMVLGLVVLAAVLNIFVNQNRTNAVQQEVAYAQQNVRAGMDIMAREIRGAGYDPQNNGFDAIQTATSNTIRVLSNLSGDDEAGNPNDANEDITYTIDSANRRITRMGNPMIENVVPNSLVFTYFRANGTSFAPASQTDRNDIRVVAIQFQVHTQNEDPGLTGGYDLYPSSTGTCRTRTLATRVRIRNVGFKDLQ